MIILQTSIQDNATPALTALLGSLKNTQPALEVGAQAAANVLRDHFRQRQAQGNKRGWRSQGFWSAQARGTAVADVTDTEATIAVSDPTFPGGLARRISPINPMVPKRVSNLAIPAIAAAAAAGSPREGGGPANLAFVFARVPPGGRWPGDRSTAQWAPALAPQEDVWKEVGKPRKDGTRRRKLVHQAGETWWWLVKSVSQQPDPEALPDMQNINDAAQLAILRFLNTSYGARTQL